MARLLIKNADGTTSTYEIEGVCTIGRHPESTVVLDHVSVSGHHAELFAHEGAYLLKDLMSSNGTYVNGEKIMVRHLNHGDQIRFGKVDAAVAVEEMQEPPAQSGPPPLLNDPGGHGEEVG